MGLEKIDELFDMIDKNNEIIDECNENIEAIEKLYKKIVESDGE